MSTKSFASLWPDSSMSLDIKPLKIGISSECGTCLRVHFREEPFTISGSCSCGLQCQLSRSHRQFVLINQLYFKVSVISFSDKVIDLFSVITCKLVTYITENIVVGFATPAERECLGIKVYK